MRLLLILCLSCLLLTSCAANQRTPVEEALDCVDLWRLSECPLWD